MKEVNYDAGRPMSTYVSLLQKHPAPNVGHMPHFPSVDGLMNGFLLGLLVMQYVLRAERHYAVAQISHKKAYSQDPPIGALERTRDELELSVYCMRKAVDHFVQGAYVKFEIDKLLNTGRSEIDFLGRLLRAREKDTHNELVEAFFGDEQTPLDPTDFLSTLNVISNSYKHGFLLPESQGVGSPDAPNIVLFDKKNNELRSTAIVHNHHAGHLIMGFQDTINRLLLTFGSKPLT